MASVFINIWLQIANNSSVVCTKRTPWFSSIHTLKSINVKAELFAYGSGYRVDKNNFMVYCTLNSSHFAAGAGGEFLPKIFFLLCLWWATFVCVCVVVKNPTRIPNCID